MVKTRVSCQLVAMTMGCVCKTAMVEEQAGMKMNSNKYLYLRWSLTSTQSNDARNHEAYFYTCWNVKVRSS